MTAPGGLEQWIGRRVEREDVASRRLVAEFQATLRPHLAAGEGVPLGLHWCLCPDTVPSGQLGRDGHPRLGLFLPETGLPRRMWAGGEIAHHGAIRAGDIVKRVSTIEDIASKSGKSGKLCFVTVRHHYTVGGALAVDDRQDIVYREDFTSAALAGGANAPAPDAWEIAATPTLLFRYSAMTFNGHRIHYDEPYARETEGYAGLVVHGPLQATLMMNLAAERLGRAPRLFSYRGLKPLICGKPFHVDAAQAADGAIETRVIDSGGGVTMTGRAF